jgi:hypothetical protein
MAMDGCHAPINCKIGVSPCKINHLALLPLICIVQPLTVREQPFIEKLYRGVVRLFILTVIFTALPFTTHLR